MKLASLGRRITYAKGEIIIRPEDTDRSIYVVVSGMVHAYIVEESGEKNIQITYGSDDIFPLAAIAGKRLSTIYYQAISDCELVKIEAKSLLDLLKTDASLSFATLEQVILQFIQYKARVDNLEYKFARERVAYRLLLLAKKFGEYNTDGTITMQRFGQEEIGNATNVSRESVGRELKRFERLGIITYHAGKLEITKPAGLRYELAPDDSPLFIDDI